MIQQNTQIGRRQFLTMLVLSRVYSVLTYVPFMHNSVDGSTVLLGSVLGIVIVGIIAIPAFALLRRYPDADIIDCAIHAGGRGMKWIAVLFWLALILYAAVTVSNFAYFLSTTVYPQASNFLLVVLFVGVSVYGVYMGLEAFSRISTAIFLWLVIAAVFIFVSLTPKIELVNVISPLYSGGKDVLRAAFNTAVSNLELLLFLVLTPYVKGGAEKSFKWYLLFVLVAVEYITFLTLTTLGDYARAQIFPFYSVTKIAEISIFERLDSIHMSVWVLVGFVKLCVLLFAAGHMDKRFLPQPVQRFDLLINAVIVGAGAYWMLINLKSMYWGFAALSTGVPFLLLAVVIPCFFWLLDTARKRRRKGEKAA